MSPEKKPNRDADPKDRDLITQKEREREWNNENEREWMNEGEKGREKESVSKTTVQLQKYQYSHCSIQVIKNSESLGIKFLFN